MLAFILLSESNLDEVKHKAHKRNVPNNYCLANSWNL